MNTKIDKVIDRLNDKIKENFKKINYYERSNKTNEEKIKELKDLGSKYPNITVSNRYFNSIYILEDIKTTKTFVSYASSYNELVYAYYDNVCINDKKYRIYSSDYQSLAKFSNGAYSYRTGQVEPANIHIFKSDAWNDEASKTKIKSAFRKFLKKYKKGEVHFKDIELAPSYVQMLCNFE